MLDIKNEYFTLSLDLRRSTLTTKEKEVISLLLAGHDVTSIGRLKKRSVKTVSAQKRSAYKKLGVKSDISLFPGLIKRWGMQATCSVGEAPATTNNINGGDRILS